MKPLLVTGADSNYFRYAQSTIASIRMKEHGHEVLIAFLDLGCTPTELKWLAWVNVTLIEQPRHHFDFPSQAAVPSYYAGNIARAFLPDYFPGFDTYLWIDADAWVCNWSAVELLLEATARRDCAIVSEISYNSPVLYGNLPALHQWSRHYYEQVYGEAVAARFDSYPILNNGVVALTHDAPHWQAWQQRLEAGLNASPIQLTDQMALNYAIWDGLQAQTEFVPEWCNWTIHAFGLPSWQVLDGHLGQWVEPHTPFQPIGILHQTGEKSQAKRTVQTTTGETREQTLLYPSHPKYTSLTGA